MYKMVVSDFDGTLIDEYEAISLSTMLEIDKVRKDKVLFVIVTERCLSDILYYNRDFSFIDYIVACGGAVVYDVKRENVIFKKSISKSTITKVFKSVKNEIFGLRKDRKFILHDLEYIQDIYKLEVVCKNLEEAVSIKEKLLEIFKKAGLWVCGTAVDTNKYYYNQDLTGALAIVIGNEGKGIGEKVKKNCDFLVKIPMKGKIQSLNASVSTGIVVYEAVKQRIRKEN